MLTIFKFKHGELNCLFATSVAEEGLDIPDCNLIIRFDLYHSAIQYIQSRGRARHEESIYVHMIEEHNAVHRKILGSSASDESALRRFCQMLPPERLLTGNDINMDQFLAEETHKRQYTVPSTGAKLNYRQSLVVVAAFVASLPHPLDVTLAAEYIVSGAPGAFVCEVILPECSPVRRTIGQQHTRKQVAKCAAAFDLCLELLQKKYLDEYLNPVFTKQLPAMRNARLAISSKKKGTYGMRTKPGLWSVLGVPKELFATVLVLAEPSAMEHPSRPLIMFTREALPQVAPFPLFFSKDRASMVQCISIAEPMHVGADELDALAKFTLRVFHDIFSKRYDASAADLPYLLGPCNTTHDASHMVDDARSILDWDHLLFVQNNEEILRCDDLPDSFFKDKYVADPYNGARKFFLGGCRKDMKPRDPVPESVTDVPYSRWKNVPHNILNYSNSKWTGSRNRAALREDQPVVAAQLLSLRRNFLDDCFDNENKAYQKECFLVLEPLRISPVR